MARSNSHIFDLLLDQNPEDVEKVVLSRNQRLLAAGSIERHVHSIRSGAVRVVYRTEGKEINIRFGYKDNIISSIPSFFDNSPSLFDIEALRKTTVWSVKKELFVHFVRNNTSGVDAYLVLLEQLVAQQMEREIDLLTHSPAERLNRITKRSPGLFQEIPLHHIANYLRMTPETLSRLRKS